MMSDYEVDNGDHIMHEEHLNNGDYTMLEEKAGSTIVAQALQDLRKQKCLSLRISPFLRGKNCFKQSPQGA